MRPTLLFLFVAGCFPSSGPGEVNVTIDSFSNLHITATEQFVEIVVGNNHNVAQAAPCPLVDANLTARLGEIPVPLITRGGKIGDEAGDDVSDNLCGTVTLQLDGPPPDGPAVLQLSDSKTTVTCNLPDLKAARTLTQVPESDTWQWRSGQAVTVQWSPSGDLPRWEMLLSELSPVVGGMRVAGAAEIHDATIDGDLMHFMVPSVVPGSYDLPGPVGIRALRPASCQRGHLVDVHVLCNPPRRHDRPVTAGRGAPHSYAILFTRPGPAGRSAWRCRRPTGSRSRSCRSRPRWP